MPITPSILQRLNDKDPALTSLDLSFQHINAHDIQELVESLKDNPYLSAKMAESKFQLYNKEFDIKAAIRDAYRMLKVKADL